MPSTNHYELVEKLRTGTFTELHRALRVDDGRPVLIKVLHRGPWFETQKLRFRHDFEMGKTLTLPCILEVMDLEERDDSIALIFADFGGTPLNLLLKNGKLELKETIEIVLKTTEALGNLHGLGIIHNDIRPTNLYYNRETARLKVTGFGMAAYMNAESTFAHITQISGHNLKYISPEQTGRMARSVDYRTDFYSLGITLYQCLTGRLPFAATDTLELIHCHLAKIPLKPIDVNPSIPAIVSDMVMKMISKTPEERYQSAFGITADLHECLNLLEKTDTIPNFELGKHDRSEAFRIPDTLYGREHHIEKLLQAYTRTSRGNTELVLVAGYSGVGKSALIDELRRSLSSKRGYFITGKCDQYKRHIPYSALIAALEELIRTILTEPKKNIQTWRRDLINMLAPNAQILIDVIPDLKLILGPQPPVPIMPASEAQNRFDMVFIRLFRVLACEERPLVIFLDDLQWVDSSSLRILHLLVTNTDASHCLLLGAYRDNEVDDMHPLMQTLTKIRSRDVPFEAIHLSPLLAQDVVRLCADALNCPQAEAEPLAQIVFDKTEGNPFFLRQFLQHLATRNMLAFDFASGKWRCKTELIRNLSMTDNVVDFMIRRIQDLPTLTCDVLKLAACVGNRFSLNTLALISEYPPADVVEFLRKALAKEIILPIVPDNHVRVYAQETAPLNLEYRFLHDRVQEAAYSLIPGPDRKETHLRIGRALDANRIKTESEDDLFDIVNHLNIGADLITIQDERNALIRLNLEAGRRAKEAAAFIDAGIFFRNGIKLLAPDSWHSAYEMTLALYTELVEAEYLNTNFEAAQTLSDVVVREARHVLDQVGVHVVRVEYLITRNRMVEALDTALPVLEMLGYPVSPDAHELHHTDRYSKTNDLDQMPIMRDPKQLAAVQLLSIITGAAYQGKPELMVPITMTLVDLCLENGLSSYAAYAYGLYSWLLVGHYKDIERGYQVGEMALRILEHFGEHEYACKTHFIFDTFIRHWKEPHRESMRSYTRTVQMGLDSGDFVYVAYMRIWSSGYLMLTGHELDYVEQQQRQFEALMTKLKQENGLYPARIWRQLTLNLQKSPDNRSSYYGESFSPEDMRMVEETNVPLTLFAVHLARLMQTYIYGDFTTAMGHADRLRKYAHIAPCSMLLGGYVYYETLTCLAMYPSQGNQQKKTMMAHINTQLDRLREWKQHAPMNFRSKVALVEAEKARVCGNDTDAIGLYDQACDMAREDGFPHENALAAERACDFYLEQGNKRFARAFIREAYDAYCEWRAHGKAADLLKHHPDIIVAPIAEREKIIPEGNTRSMTGALDAMTLVKASQALSGEIEYDALLAKLLQLAIENAGAGRGVLMVNRNHELFIVADASGENKEARIMPNLPLDDDTLLPTAIVRLVARTRQSIVIRDAKEDATFSQNPYVITRQPRSILCMPISRGDDLMAILYLENNLSANLFTSESLQVLNVLLSQSAISLDNANLFKRKTKAEEEIRKQKNLFETMFNTIPDGVVVTNTRHEIQLANKGMESTFGYMPDELLGKTTEMLYAHQGKTPATGADDFDNDSYKSDDLYLTRYQDKFGRTFPGETFGAKLFDENKIWIGNFEIIRDITKRVEAESRLQQAQKMEAIGTLAGGIAHDFNNILFSILGNAELLQKDIPETDPVRIRVDSILAGGMRARELTQQILTFSRQNQYELREINLQPIVKEAMKLIRSTIPTTIEIKNHISKHCRRVKADPTQIHQIVMNLASNAFHAMENSGGTLSVLLDEITLDDPETVRLGLDSGVYARLTVTDSGTGIKDDIKKKIFDPFFTTKEIGKGTGMGLSVIHGIVKNLGGGISLHSRIGRGTKFDVYLPIVEKDQDETEMPTEEILQFGAERILLVDDEEVIVDVEKQILERLGYKVTATTSSVEAQKIFGSAPDDIDLVITDLTMPRMTGIELAERLAEIRDNIPVILCTGFSESISKQDAQTFRVKKVLTKPITMQELSAAIRDVLEVT